MRGLSRLTIFQWQHLHLSASMVSDANAKPFFYQDVLEIQNPAEVPWKKLSGQHL